jgi:hypothetical protein
MHGDGPAYGGMDDETAQVQTVVGIVLKHEREFRVWVHKWGRVLKSEYILDAWYPDVFEGRPIGPHPRWHQAGLQCGYMSNQTNHSTIVRPGPGNTYEGRQCYIACLPEVFIALANDETATVIYDEFVRSQVVIAAKARRGTSGRGKGQKGKRKGSGW